MKKLCDQISFFLCSVFVIFHLYTAIFGPIPENGQRCIHLALILGILFVNLIPKDAGKPILVGLDLILFIAGISSALYIWLISHEYDLRGGVTYTRDIVFGIFLITALLYATWRKIGAVLSIVAMTFILYAFLGIYAPSILHHGGFRLSRWIHLIVYTADGILGSPLSASANYIVLFIMLGAVFNASGVGDYFTSLANAAFGRFRGGPAKVAVVASAFFGSISGSSIANVIGTGTFTIPMMKKMKFEPEFAGAVEAAASTGGQIMPPIMGAAAFLVAEILQISYWDVVRAAIMPAILYFTAIFITVDLYARRKGLKGLNRSELPSLKSLIKRVYLFSPLILLMLLIGPFHLSISRSGIITLIFTVVIVSFNKESRFSREKIVKTVNDAAKGCVSVAVACALVGIIIGTIIGSGLGYRLSNVLVDVSGGSLPILLIMTMIVALILGMGVPTSAAYLMLATLVAPAIVKLGVFPIAAHLFLFYYGIISNVTPPVAMASYAAAGIAQCSPSKCGFQAFKLAISGLILPMIFVYNPVMLGRGSWYEILYCLVTAVFAVYCLSSVTEGFFINWSITIIERVLLAIASISFVFPKPIIGISGVIFVAIVFASSNQRYKKNQSRRIVNNTATSN